MKKIISLSAALILASAFVTGCGKSSSSSSEKEKSKFEGKWQCTDITIGDEVMPTVLGMEASSLFQIEILEDNKGTFLSALFSEENKPDDIQWKETGENKIELSGGPLDDLNEPIVFEYKDDKLVIEMSDEGDEEQAFANLVKVDEFTPISDDSGMSIDISE